jgi:hypothetical protein
MPLWGTASSPNCAERSRIGRLTGALLVRRAAAGA